FETQRGKMTGLLFAVVAMVALIFVGPVEAHDVADITQKSEDADIQLTTVDVSDDLSAKQDIQSVVNTLMRSTEMKFIFLITMLFFVTFILFALITFEMLNYYCPIEKRIIQ
uniref:Uncharacterized protein n=1 Tax=Parascaris univalens TaxID=6257 RepID=A0A915BGI3_PARUN